MGFFDRLFAKKAPASATAATAATSATSARLAEVLQTPPRLINEGPEFPHVPLLLRRQVSREQVDAALAAAGFSVDGDRFNREGVTLQWSSNENGLRFLDFSGADAPVQRAILAELPWVDPRSLYAELADPQLAPVDICHLLWATRHYRCAGGIPGALRQHPAAEVKEAIRLIERAQMADAARAQRKKK